MAFGPRFATPEEHGRGQRDETEQEEEPQHDRITGRVLGSCTRLVGEPARGEIGRCHAERLHQRDESQRRAQMTAGTSEKLIPIMTVDTQRLRSVSPSTTKVTGSSNVPKVSISAR